MQAINFILYKLKSNLKRDDIEIYYQCRQFGVAILN